MKKKTESKKSRDTVPLNALTRSKIVPKLTPFSMNNSLWLINVTYTVQSGYHTGTGTCLVILRPSTIFTSDKKFIEKHLRMSISFYPLDPKFHNLLTDY
jgi:hypothetical protein